MFSVGVVVFLAQFGFKLRQLFFQVLELVLVGGGALKSFFELDPFFFQLAYFGIDPIGVRRAKGAFVFLVRFGGCRFLLFDGFFVFSGARCALLRGFR